MRELKRGQIYYLNNNNLLGYPMKKDRPVIIVSNNKCNAFSNAIEVIFLSTNLKKVTQLPTHIFINSSVYPSVALCESITTVRRCDIFRYIGTCTETEIKSINKALLVSLGMRGLLNE